MRYLLRPLEKKDIPAVIKGEEKIFGVSLGEDYLISELELNPFAQYIALDIDGVLHGYIGIWVADNMQIINFYVDKEYQNMGFGTMLLEFVIRVCEDSKIKNLSLEVRESNKIAISFYEKYGFMEKTKRKNYYNDGEDALLMVKEFEVNDDSTRS